MINSKYCKDCSIFLYNYEDLEVDDIPQSCGKCIMKEKSVQTTRTFNEYKFQIFTSFSDTNVWTWRTDALCDSAAHYLNSRYGFQFGDREFLEMAPGECRKYLGSVGPTTMHAPPGARLTTVYIRVIRTLMEVDG